MKHGKKYQEVAKLVDRTTLLEPADAIALRRRDRAGEEDRVR